MVHTEQQIDSIHHLLLGRVLVFHRLLILALVLLAYHLLHLLLHHQPKHRLHHSTLR
jgi:hypothetical protein